MSVKILKINIYKNNRQTTVHDPRTKNVAADALSQGYRLRSGALTSICLLSLEERHPQSLQFWRTQRACVHSEVEAFFAKGTVSQDFWLHLERSGI